MRKNSTRPLVLATSLLAVPATVPAALLVDVNVAGMGAGPAPSIWSNAGSVTGDFSLVNQAGQPNPEIEVIGGIAGIHLNREQPFQNVYQGPLTPSNLTAPGASRSIEVWANNPEIADGGEEMMVGWGRRGGPDGTNMSFGWTNQPAFGAVGQWGGGPDVPWGDNGSLTPSAGEWHHLVYTYDGTTTSLFADGAFVHSENVGSLDTHDGFSFIIGGQNAQNAPHDPTVDGVGAGSFGGNFRGLINTVRIHDEALSEGDIAAAFAAGPAQIPEPAAGLGVLALGLTAMVVHRRRRR